MIAAHAPTIDLMYEEHAKKHHIPSTCYALIVDGQVAHTKCIGKEGATSSTLFRVASMTKSLTAMAILQLRDAGKLNLCDPISKHVPQFTSALSFAVTPDGETITIAHLLNMMSGLPQDDPWADRLLAASDKALLEQIIPSLSFASAAGTQMEYSNVGYAILGLVIAAANGQGLTYPEYVKKHILKPLDMNNSTFDKDAIAAAAPSSSPHTPPPLPMAVGQKYYADTGHEKVPILASGSFDSMGGLFSSIDDWSKYAAFHMSAYPIRGHEQWDPLDALSHAPAQAQASKHTREHDRHIPSFSIFASSLVAGSSSSSSSLSSSSSEAAGDLEYELQATLRMSSLRELHRAKSLDFVTGPTVEGVNNASVTAPANVSCYAGGLRVHLDSEKHTWIRHAGGLPGYGSEWRFLPHHGLAIVSFGNVTYAPQSVINNKIMYFLLNEAKVEEAGWEKEGGSTEMEMMAVSLRELLMNAWGDKAADEQQKQQQQHQQQHPLESSSPLFTSNFFLDDDLPRRRQQLAEAVGKIGGIITDYTPYKPINHLRGTFYLHGSSSSRKKLRVLLTCAPTTPPRMQAVEISVVDKDSKK